MKTRLLILIFALALLPTWQTAVAQVAAKTLDTVQEIGPDGSVNLTFQMAFDAEPWGRWKSAVGDDPARLRGMLRHHFAAYVIDDFKFEKDDLNRTARMMVHSPAGPELRKDQRLEISVDPWCRLISHTDREWFFSGNNPSAGNQQNTVKITLPPNTIEAVLVNAGTSGQVLVYALRTPAGKSRILVWVGLGLGLVGVGLAATGLLLKKPDPPPPVAASDLQR